MRFSLRAVLVASLCLAVASSHAADEKKDPPKPADVFTNPADAGPDFKIQGEYEGEVKGKGKFGAQVFALGDGKFDVYFLAGGLPGAGWDARSRTRVAAKTEGDKTALVDKLWSGAIADGV